MTDVVGVLLAAGAGRRFGMAKALVPGWIEHAVASLAGGGCDEVVVVLGAQAEPARTLVPPGARVVVAHDWESGQAASVRAGLTAATEGGAVAAMVHLVDLPDVGADVVTRLLEHAHLDTLARAVYGGRPGHPVLIGRSHWPGLLDGLGGDTGAKAYLDGEPVSLVECGDLATGRDVDHPTDDQPDAE